MGDQRELPGDALRGLGPKAPTKEQRQQYGWTQNWEHFIGSLVPSPTFEEVDKRTMKVQVHDLTGGAAARFARQRAEEDRYEYANEVLRGVYASPADEQQKVYPAEAPCIKPPRSNGGDDVCIPQLGLGTWKAERGAVRDAVEHALRTGWRHVDCAAVYQNEGEVGDALSLVFESTDLQPSDVFVATKLWNDSHAKGNARQAVMRSLKLLKLRQLDCVLVHWPVVSGNVGTDDVQPPLEETWRALESLVLEGRVRVIGVSNFAQSKIQRIMQSAIIRPSVVQVEIHPYWRQQKLLSFCEQNALHVTAYSALGSPDSESIIQRPSKKLLEDETVHAVAEQEQLPKAQVLLSWGISTRPHCSLLVKSVNKERISSNIKAVHLRLHDDSIAQLSSLRYQRRMVDGTMFLSSQGPYRTLTDLWGPGEEGIPEDE